MQATVHRLMSSEDDDALRAKKLRIQRGPTPPKYTRAPNQEALRMMGCGDWVIVSHKEAESLRRASRDLGGRVTTYRTSETTTCVKVLEAPWKDETIG